jgi:branched-subunit amino acid transport protein
MGLWVPVLAAGAISLAFRWLPVFTFARSGLQPRTAEGLRHAGAGAITALVVLSLLGTPGHWIHWPVLAAVVVGGLLARRGRSMALSVLAGGCVYALVTVLPALL